MENGNQPKLEDTLLNLGSLATVSEGINKSGDYSERASLYEGAASLIAGPKVIETEQGKRENPDHKNLMREFRHGPEYVQLLIQGNIGTKASEIKDEYESKRQEILRQIISLIDTRLSKARNKIEATQILMPYLEDFIKLKEPTQEESNEAENRNFEHRLKIPYAFDQIGSTEHYRSLVMRNILSDYIIEQKENDRVTYKVDKDKLSKITDNIVSGAILYTKAKAIEEAEKAEEKYTKAKAIEEAEKAEEK